MNKSFINLLMTVGFVASSLNAADQGRLGKAKEVIAMRSGQLKDKTSDLYNKAKEYGIIALDYVKAHPYAIGAGTAATAAVIGGAFAVRYYANKANQAEANLEEATKQLGAVVVNTEAILKKQAQEIAALKAAQVTAPVVAAPVAQPEVATPATAKTHITARNSRKRLAIASKNRKAARPCATCKTTSKAVIKKAVKRTPSARRSK